MDELTATLQNVEAKAAASVSNSQRTLDEAHSLEQVETRLERLTESLALKRTEPSFKQVQDEVACLITQHENQLKSFILDKKLAPGLNEITQRLMAFDE